MDEKDLKIEAMKQQFAARLSGMMTEYEDTIADLRVSNTVMSQRLEQYEAKTNSADEPVEGTVVNE